MGSKQWNFGVCCLLQAPWRSTTTPWPPTTISCSQSWQVSSQPAGRCIATSWVKILKCFYGTRRLYRVWHSSYLYILFGLFVEWDLLFCWVGLYCLVEWDCIVLLSGIVLSCWVGLYCLVEWDCIVLLSGIVLFCWGDGRNDFNSSSFLYIYLYLFWFSCFDYKIELR